MSTKISLYDDFIEVIVSLGINPLPKSKSEDKYVYTGKKYGKEEKNKPERHYISVEWSTGGVSGGSCWDDSKPQAYVSDDVPQDLTALDTILESITPNITFLQYKNLTNNIVKTFSYTDNSDYYGNYTNYVVKECNLLDLYNALVERKLL